MATTFNWREAAIEACAWNFVSRWRTPEQKAAELERGREYHRAMSDEDLYDELISDTYKAGQDSMSYY